MHKFAEKIADCLKAKVEGMGIDNIEGQDLVELGMWTDIIKDLVCYDKDKKIIEAMDEAEESEEAMKYIEMYEDYPEMRRGYRGQPRDSRGRYMSRRGRRGYEEPMYRMSVEDYKMHEPEYWRDLDRVAGRMYYTDENMSMDGNTSTSNMGNGSTRGYSENNGGQYSSRMQREGLNESRYDRAKRAYTETKEMHKSGSADDKQITMKEGEKMLNVIMDEIDEMLQDTTPEMKNMVKTKVMARMQKI